MLQSTTELLIKEELEKTTKNDKLLGNLELINSGKVQVNNRKVKIPNYICSQKDTISVSSEKGNSPKKIQLSDYLRTI